MMMYKQFTWISSFKSQVKMLRISLPLQSNLVVTTQNVMVMTLSTRHPIGNVGRWGTEMKVAIPYCFERREERKIVHLKFLSWIEISKILRTFNTISKIVDNLSGQNWKSMSLKISRKKCSHFYTLYIWYYRGLFSFMSSQPDCCAFFMQLNSSCVCIRVNALVNLQLCYFMGLCYSAVFPTKRSCKRSSHF